MRVSPYKLSIFRRCPLRYKFMYIDFLGDQYKKEWPHLVFGRAIHGALADFYRLPPRARNLEALQRLLRQHWVKQDRTVFKSGEEERMWGERALSVFEGYLHTADLEAAPEIIEERLEVLIGNFVLMGRIDRVDRIPGGGYEIIDYKTGTYMPSQQEFGCDLQLSMYALGLYHQRAIFASHLTAHYLQANRRLTTTRTKEALDGAVEEIERLIGEIEGTKEFKPRVNQFCTWCDFLEICPSKKQAEQVAAIEIEDLPF